VGKRVKGGKGGRVRGEKNGVWLRLWIGRMIRGGEG
jgi:hypothetical protein